MDWRIFCSKKHFLQLFISSSEWALLVKHHLLMAFSRLYSDKLCVWVCECFHVHTCMCVCVCDNVYVCGGECMFSCVNCVPWSVHITVSNHFSLTCIFDTDFTMTTFMLFYSLTLVLVPVLNSKPSSGLFCLTQRGPISGVSTFPLPLCILWMYVYPLAFWSKSVLLCSLSVTPVYVLLGGTISVTWCECPPEMYDSYEAWVWHYATSY